MTDRGPTCPLCGDACKSLDHVRQHLHTDHRKFELIEAWYDRDGDDVVDPDDPDLEHATRVGAFASRAR